MVKHLVSLSDLSKDEILRIINNAFLIKKRWYDYIDRKPLINKNIALVFELPSTRTRISFEVAGKCLGANTYFIKFDELQLARGESISDTCNIFSDFFDAIVMRVLKHEILLEFAKYLRIPVINALTIMYHPTQALTDIMTIFEVKGFRSDLRIAYVGDGYNNVCHSLILICSKLGLEMNVASPKGYEPAQEVLNLAQEYAKESGAKIKVYNNPIDAVQNADVIYTDVFISMGREEEKEKRLRDFSGWQVNKELVRYAKPDYIFMHCLPAHRGEEVAPEIIDDPKHSVIWLQAKNKLFIASALYLYLLRI